MTPQTGQQIMTIHIVKFFGGRGLLSRIFTIYRTAGERGKLSL